MVHATLARRFGGYRDGSVDVVDAVVGVDRRAEYTHLTGFNARATDRSRHGKLANVK